MKQHVTIIGYLFIVLGALYLVAAVIVGLILVGSGLIAASEGETEPLGILLIVAVAVGLLLFVRGLPGIIGGWGLLKFKPWARILVLILAALNLLSFPLGTALGVYTFWALLNSETEALFRSGGSA